MPESHWSNWATDNQHDRRGPRYIAPGTRAVGLSAKEQAGFGVIDVRLFFQSASGGQDATEGATRLPDGRWKDVFLPANEGTITGVIVHEQYGHGVIDIQLKYVDENGSEHVSPGATRLPGAQQKIDLDLPSDYELTGFVCSKQNGFGVVDFRIHGTKHDPPPQS